MKNKRLLSDSVYNCFISDLNAEAVKQADVIVCDFVYYSELNLMKCSLLCLPLPSVFFLSCKSICA